MKSIEIRLNLMIPEGDEDFQKGYAKRAIEQIEKSHEPEHNVSINDLLDAGWSLTIPDI